MCSEQFIQFVENDEIFIIYWSFSLFSIFFDIPGDRYATGQKSGASAPKVTVQDGTEGENHWYLWWILQGKSLLIFVVCEVHTCNSLLWMCYTNILTITISSSSRFPTFLNRAYWFMLMLDYLWTKCYRNETWTSWWKMT